MALSTRANQPLLAAAGGLLAGLLAIAGMELGALIPALALGAGAMLLLAFLRPLWALYAAVVLIPLEPLATSFGTLTFSPTEALLSAAAIGWATRRAMDGRLSWARTPLTAPLALFVVSMVPGLLFAIDRDVIVKQLASGLLIFGCFLLFVTEARMRDVRRMVFIVAMVGAIVGAIAIFSPPVSSPTRVQGPFNQANTLGQFIALAVPLQVALAIASRGPVRLVLVAAVLVSLGGLIASGSRGSFLGIAAMSLVLLAWRPFRYVALVSMLVVASMLLSGLGPSGGTSQLGELKERFLRIGKPSDESSTRRLELYRKTPKMILDNPLFGVGASNFYTAAPRYNLVLPNSRFAQAHSTPLAVASERGLLGLTGLIWFVVALFTTIRRILRRAPPDWVPIAWGLAPVFAAQFLICIFEYSVPAAPLTLTLLILAGCVCILDRAFAGAPTKERAPSPPDRIPSRERFRARAPSPQPVGR